MNIRELNDNLLKIYDEMSLTFATFQKNSGLPCVEGCGKCCLNPEIEASVIEMIPFALKMHDEGKLDEWLNKLQTTEQNTCILYEGDSKGRGRCAHYSTRPAVCRMFGVAGYFNKEKRPTLSICKYIREALPSQVVHAESQIFSQEIPVMAEWNALLVQLGDPTLQRKIPLNEAIRQALEKVSLYAQYQAL